MWYGSKWTGTEERGMAAVGPVRKSGHLRVQAAPDEAVAWDVQG